MVYSVRVACRTGAIFLRFQASGGERERGEWQANAERESRDGLDVIFFSRPNPVARDSGLVLRARLQTQKTTPVLQATVRQTTFRSVYVVG